MSIGSEIPSVWVKSEVLRSVAETICTAMNEPYIMKYKLLSCFEISFSVVFLMIKYKI